MDENVKKVGLIVLAVLALGVLGWQVQKSTAADNVEVVNTIHNEDAPLRDSERGGGEGSGDPSGDLGGKIVDTSNE